MLNTKAISVGQIIRRIRSCEIAPVYALYGGDAFFEEYFIQELTINYSGNKENKKYFSLDIDKEEILFKELSTISLFEEKRIIIVREIKRIKSINMRQELIQYIQAPNHNISLILISSEYELTNKFLNQIAKESDFIDMRPPFRQKMKQWVQYFVKNKNIQI